jgi:Ig domain of plant-specific actin-binding protein
MSLNRRLLGAVGATGALALIVALFAAIGSVTPGNAASSQYGPQNTGSPAITGTAQEGSTLTASTGQWTSTNTITYSYQWQQCDSQGANCAAISKANGSTYVVQTGDVGKTLRVIVTATTSDGNASATSAPTAVVVAKQPAGPAGQIKVSNGKTSVPVSSLSLPYRLVVNSVSFSPATIVSRSPVQMQVLVTEATTGFVVRDALVYVTAVPFARLQQPPEVQTNQDGVATITLEPTARLPLQKGYLLTMFVRARKPGENPLAGISTRRLVSLHIG